MSRQAGSLTVPSTIRGGASALLQRNEAFHLNPKPVQGCQCPGGGAYIHRNDRQKCLRVPHHIQQSRGHLSPTAGHTSQVQGAGKHKIISKSF